MYKRLWSFMFLKNGQWIDERRWWHPCRILNQIGKGMQLITPRKRQQVAWVTPGGSMLHSWLVRAYTAQSYLPAIAGWVGYKWIWWDGSLVIPLSIFESQDMCPLSHIHRLKAQVYFEASHAKSTVRTNPVQPPRCMAATTNPALFEPWKMPSSIRKPQQSV